LTGILGSEVPDFEVDHDVAAQAQVVEEEIQIEVLLADRQVVLAADEGESDTEFQEERADVADQPALQVALMRLRSEAEEVEIVGVFQQLPGEIRLRRGERAGEVGHRTALSPVQPALD